MDKEIEKQHFYLKALEIGFDSKDIGVSFNETNEKLNQLEYEFNEDLFRDWYYRNFEHKNRVTFSNKPTTGVSADLDNTKYRLSSDSLFQYLEYLELKEARVNSKSARKQSLIAIGIAILSLLVSVGTSVAGILYQSKPERQREIQLKELIEINNENQNVLDSCLHELHKLRLINENIEKTQQTARERNKSTKKL